MFAVRPHTQPVTRDFLSVERDGVFKFNLTLIRRVAIIIVSGYYKQWQYSLLYMVVIIKYFSDKI